MSSDDQSVDESDPLEDLYVDASNINQERIRDALTDLIAIDRETGNPRFYQEFDEIDTKGRLTAVLLYRRAPSALNDLDDDEEIGDETHCALLGICAGTADYRLAGDAQLFWNELEQVSLDRGQLISTRDIKEILGEFMEADLNSQLNQQKRTRLIKLFDEGFADWFIETYGEVQPLDVWEDLADALDNPMKRKTIVFAMKVYDSNCSLYQASVSPNWRLSVGASISTGVSSRSGSSSS
ncbi:N-glycosylase/DNA lyase [Halorubrum sp. FL23]|uniref:N-glycosylase/DNA lyase n=1 Tax=Halorubrum sp. FL23 TaxID=3458704 RepID=UPI0040344676